MLLAFALLAFVIWRNRRTDQRYLLTAAGCAACSAWRFWSTCRRVLLTFIRWFMLVRVIEPKFKLSSTFVLGSIGMVFNLVIPGGVGGDLIKASYLVRMRIRRTQAIASMVIDRILGLLALFILAAVAGAIAWRGARRATFARSRCLRGSRCWPVCSSWWRSSPVRSAGCSRGAADGGSKFGLIVSELREMSTTYRGRLECRRSAAWRSRSSSTH